MSSYPASRGNRVRSQLRPFLCTNCVHPGEGKPGTGRLINIEQDYNVYVVESIAYTNTIRKVVQSNRFYCSKLPISNTCAIYNLLTPFRGVATVIRGEISGHG
jgi:hypothetical protein